MPHPPGTRLGPYEIDVPLGGGRQGDVYAARDTRLDREVAIKVLSEDYSHSTEDLERFRREARTLAALNHPHICVIHDIGREEGIDFLVMERVEGETLAQRISRGPLPIADVLKLGAQIADALGRAHRAGAVHRDLKPLNVMLTKSGAKLMDFGLASALRVARAEGTAATALPHLKDSVTAEGMIVGTVPYMAPEQLEGKPADGRVDIWALGCVLYEMVTRRQPFDGETQAELISGIMRGEPPAMSESEPLAPPALERAVRQCLAKDPDDRWQTAGDLRRELLWIAESGSRTGVPATLVRRRKSRERLAWSIAAVAVVAAAGFAVKALEPRPEPKPLVFNLAPPQYLRPGAFGGGLYGVDIPRISPDGRHLAITMEDSLGVRRIWVRHMASLNVEPLAGTEGAKRCFWSPDSRFLAFFSGEKLYKVDLAGGAPIPICDAPRGDLGSWGTRGMIVFDWSSGDSVQVVPASGGIPVGVKVVDRAKGEGAAWPEFLPDGRHFVYIVGVSAQNRGRVALRVGSIESEEPKTIGESESNAAWGSGHLLYMRGNVLVAQKLDPDALRFVGEPFPVAESVDRVRQANRLFKFSVSSEGTLVYKIRAGESRLVWFDRAGNQLGSVGEPAKYRAPALSPDDTRLAVPMVQSPENASDIWVWDLASNLASRFTSTSADESSPVWSHDGTRLAYGIARGDFNDIYVKPTGGRGMETLLYRSDRRNYPHDWSQDGRAISFSSVIDTPWDVDAYLLSFGDSVRATPLLVGAADEGHARFSPDGRWLAYASDESGRYEIYVSSFPEMGRKWRVSTSGGDNPRWRGDGKELYYVTLAGDVMSVMVEEGPSLPFSAPRRLFSIHGGSGVVEYDVTKDGKRFIVVTPEADESDQPTTVVVDWLGRLGKQ